MENDLRLALCGQLYFATGLLEGERGQIVGESIALQSRQRFVDGGVGGREIDRAKVKWFMTGLIEAGQRCSGPDVVRGPYFAQVWIRPIYSTYVKYK